MPGPRPKLVRDTLASDWVLLEIDDPSFYHQPAIRALGDEQPLKDKTLTVTGFPFGAGTIAERQEAEAQGRGKDYPFWKDGRPVLAATAKSFRPADHAEPGMLDYEGPEETRPGMSGGGIFDDDRAFVGIHRSNSDPTMRRGAVRAESIARFLRDTHRMEFSPGTTPRHDHWYRRTIVKRSLIAAGACAFLLLVTFWLWPKPVPVPNPIELKVYVSHHTEKRGPIPVAGLKVAFESDQWSGISTDGETDSDGLAVIKFMPNSRPAPGDRIFGYLICRNEPAGLGDDGPYILRRHGRFSDGATKEKPLDLTRGAIDCFLYGRKAYWGETFTRAFADNTAQQNTPPEIKSGTQNLIQEIAKISSLEGFSKEETQFATEGWSEQLKKERPVVSLQELEKHLPADATALRRLAGSVGRLRVENGDSPYSSSAFLIAENLVLVPEYALPSNLPSSKMRIEFPNVGDSDSVAVVKVPWVSKEHRVALCEISKTHRAPLKIGIRRPMPQEPAAGSISLSGRKIVVLGFPSADLRLPKEINDLFVGVGNRLAVMPGKIMAPKSGKSPNGEISHDATTSAGVGGGPVIDLDSLLVIAMHKGGIFAGERKENQAVELKVLWDDPSFREALLPYGKVLTESLRAPESDPLRLSKSDRFVAAYNPTFLGCSIALPSVISKSGEQERDSIILDYVNFSVRMHPVRRMALFAAANIDRSLLKRVRRDPDVWHFDPRISRNAQFGEEIYAKNDFDRGHLIARSSVAWGPTLGFSEKAASSVFYWPNATPQHMHFNQTAWSKLEQEVYHELHPESNRLAVFCGPVFDASDIKERDAFVPRRFWMIGVYENPDNAEKPKVHAFLAEQYRFDASNEPVFVGRSNDCVKSTTVEEIQSVTGLRISIPK